MKLPGTLAALALAAGLVLALPPDLSAQQRHRHQRGCGHAGYGGGYRYDNRAHGYRPHGYAYRPHGYAPRPYAYGYYRPYAYGYAPLPYAPTYGYAPAYGAPYPYAPYPPAYGYPYGGVAYGYRAVPHVAPAPYWPRPHFSLSVGW